MTADTRVKVVEALLFYAAGLASDVASELPMSRGMTQTRNKLKMVSELKDLADQLRQSTYLDN